MSKISDDNFGDAMKEINLGSVISVFELLVYVSVGSIGLTLIFKLFDIENFIITNSFVYSITFFAMSYCLGFILHYIGIKIYKCIPHKSFTKTLLNKCETCMHNYFNECQNIAQRKCGYTYREEEKYSELLYYKMRYTVAKRYSWNNFAEYANIYHYFALSLATLILLFIPIVTIKIINQCTCPRIELYLFYLFVSILFILFFFEMAEHFEKIHVRRVVNTYLNMGKNKE